MAEELQNKGGRPSLTLEEKAEKIKDMSQKLEPYLKSGLSIRKALAEVKISKTDFYRMMDSEEGFRDTIYTFRQFTAVLLNNAIVHELMAIVEKQNRNEPLSKVDRQFLFWFALNSNNTKEEWGRRENISLYDPEAEIQKIKAILEESTTKEILHIN